MVTVMTAPVLARQIQMDSEQVAVAVAGAAKTATPAEQPATLTYSNRAIVVFRATVLARPPHVRATAAVNLLDRLVQQTPAGRASTRAFDDAIAIGIDDHPVFVLFRADVDPLEGEELATKAADAAARLQLAFDEAVELRTPQRLARSGAIALAVTLVFVLAIWLLVRTTRASSRRLSTRSRRGGSRSFPAVKPSSPSRMRQRSFAG